MRALASSVSLLLCACSSDRSPRPDSQDHVEVAESGPAPEEPRETPPSTLPPVDEPAPEPVAASLADRVADLALVNQGELLCTDGTQCSSQAPWANCGLESPKVSATDDVKVITHNGIEDAILKTEKYSVRVRSGSGDKIEFGLAMRNARPSPSARIEPRRLDPKVSASEAKLVRKWLEASLQDSLTPGSLEPIGAIDGRFGGDLDRILVFAPKPRERNDDEEWEPESDFAVALAGGEPRGILPFGAVSGLEVVRAVDLDGDGIHELVWVSQQAAETLVTRISMVWFDGSELVVHDIAGCSYTGCDGFFPADECGHSEIKWKNGRKP